MSNLNDFTPGKVHPKCVQLYKFDNPFPWKNEAEENIATTGTTGIGQSSNYKEWEVGTTQVKYGNASCEWKVDATSFGIYSYHNIIGNQNSWSYSGTNQADAGLNVFTQEFWAYHTGSGSGMRAIFNANQPREGQLVNGTPTGINDLKPTNQDYRFGMFYDNINDRMYYRINDQDNYEYEDSFGDIDDAWHHYVYQRNGDDIRFYYDGTLKKQYSHATLESTLGSDVMSITRWIPQTIGPFGHNNNASSSTYINQYRVTLDALYDANFTPGNLADF